MIWDFDLEFSIFLTFNYFLTFKRVSNKKIASFIHFYGILLTWKLNTKERFLSFHFLLVWLLRYNNKVYDI